MILFVKQFFAQLNLKGILIKRNLTFLFYIQTQSKIEVYIGIAFFEK